MTSTKTRQYKKAAGDNLVGAMGGGVTAIFYKVISKVLVDKMTLELS